MNQRVSSATQNNTEIPKSVSRDKRFRRSLTSMPALAVIGVVLAGYVTLANCQNGPTVPGASKVLTKATEKELTFSSHRVAVVMVVDEAGQIQAFRPEGTRSIPIALPGKPDQIAAVKTITVFKTTNPKWCRITSDGQEECIVW